MGLMSPQPSPKDPWPEPPPLAPASLEQLTVARWRYRTARKAGLSIVESQMFADSHADIGSLRNMAAAGRSPSEIVDLLLL